MTNPFFLPPAFDAKDLVADMERRFGWSEPDLTRAMEALAPAAFAGLRRKGVAADGFPDFSALFDAATASQAGSLAREEEGSEALSRLQTLVFGSHATRTAIADKVAGMTGLGSDGIERLMPVVATLAVGDAARNFTSGPAREMLDAFLAGYARGRPEPAPSPFEAMAPFAQAMETFWGSFSPKTDAQSSFAAKAPSAGGQAKKSAAGAASEDLWEGWLSAGRNLQESQVQMFDAIFQQKTKP